MSNPEIQPALTAMGFTADATNAKDVSDTEGDKLSVFPNPSTHNAQVAIDLLKSETVSLDIADVNGRVVKKVFQNKNLPEGKNLIDVETNDLSSGVYVIILRGSNFLKKEKLLITH